MTERSPSEEPTPDEVRAFTALMHQKKLAIIGTISVHLEGLDGLPMGEVLDMADEFAADLDDQDDMGARAIQAASNSVILHLLRSLAIARGEPVEQVWQRVAAAMIQTSEDGG